MRALKIIASVVIVSLAVAQCSKDGSAESFDGTGLSGSTARFTISGKTLCTVDNQSLHLFDLTNGGNPSKISDLNLGENIETIFSLGNKLFVGSQTGVKLVDIQTPQAPTITGEVSHFTSCDPVVSDGVYAYSTISSGNTCRFGGNQLDIIDISNFLNPFVIQSYSMVNPRGLAIDGNWLFVCDNGIKMFDKSDVMNLDLVDQKTGIPANDVIAEGNILVVTAEDGIYQYNYSSGKLVFISKIVRVL